LFFAEGDLEGLRALAEKQLAYEMCRSKLAEVLEKVVKAELIRMGWFLEKTHDLQKLANELAAHGSDLMGTVKPLCNALAEVYFSDRYPGFDLGEPEWPDLRAKLEEVTRLLEKVRARVGGS
jgi:HEPN domain-containing protein